LWPLVMVLAIHAASSESNLASPKLGFSYDKIAHLLVFGLLATTILRIPDVFKLGWRGVYSVILVVAVCGLLDECRQLFTPGRSVELNDWLADSCGAILASILYFKWHWYRHLLEYPCFVRKRSTAPTQTPGSSPSSCS